MLRVCVVKWIPDTQSPLLSWWLLTKDTLNQPRPEHLTQRAHGMSHPHTLHLAPHFSDNRLP